MTLLHPREGDMSADGRKVRQHISVGSLCFRIFYLAFFVLLLVSSIYHYVFWDPESYMTRELSPSVIFLIPSLICLWLVYHPYEWVLTPEAREKEEKLRQQKMIANSAGGGILRFVGVSTGIVAALLVFLAVYVAAIVYSGWVVGIALGWIPAILAALVAGVLIRYLWWVIAIGVLGLFGLLI